MEELIDYLNTLYRQNPGTQPYGPDHPVHRIIEALRAGQLIYDDDRPGSYLEARERWKSAVMQRPKTLPGECND